MSSALQCASAVDKVDFTREDLVWKENHLCVDSLILAPQLIPSLNLRVLLGGIRKWTALFREIVPPRL